MRHRRSRLEQLAYVIAPTIALLFLILLVFHAGYFRKLSSPKPSVSREPAAPKNPEHVPSPSGAVKSNQEAAMVVEHWDYRRTSDFDPGTIRVYLRNAGDSPLRIRQVLLDELPIPVWSVDLTINAVKPEGELTAAADSHAEAPTSAALRFSGKRVVWARLAPEAIPPRQTAEFAAKLSNPMNRPMKVEILPTSAEAPAGKPDAGAKVSLVVRPVLPKLQISAVTFSPKYDRLYVYVQNQSEDALEIADCLINEQSMKSCSWWGRGALRKGEKRLIVAALKKPLQQGQCITLKIIADGGVQTMERIRAFSGFPINSEAGGGLSDFGGDAAKYDDRPTYLSLAVPLLYDPARNSSPAASANYIFQCPMHEYGCNQERCAREILRRYDLSQRFDADRPCFVHVCRIRPETGYALFAETCDILRINSNVISGLGPRREREPSEETVEHLTRNAVNAARPAPVHAVADTSIISDANEKPASASDFRRRTWTILGCGVKGLFYREATWRSADGAALGQEIKRTNQVLQSLREYLSIADTVDWASTPDNHFSAHTLLAGDRALVVFLVRHDRPIRDATPIAIQVRVPSWLSLDPEVLEGRVQSASEIGPLKPTPVPSQANEVGVTLTITPPVDATVLLLPLQRGQP